MKTTMTFNSSNEMEEYLYTNPDKAIYSVTKMPEYSYESYVYYCFTTNTIMCSENKESFQLPIEYHDQWKFPQNHTVKLYKS